MDNRKLIAEALLEIAKKSNTEFFEVGSDYDIIEKAEKLGIKLPSPDLALFKTIYAEIDKPNRNNVILPKKAVEDGLETLKFKQINWEHQGSGHVCGYIIDAKIIENRIEIVGVIFKSLFPEEMEKVKEKFEKKELAVSFEIWNKNPETGKSVVKELENGTREINPIIFHGCGLLVINQPACPKAVVYKLIAKAIEGTEKIVDMVFGEDLIFAELANEEPKCKNCTTCTCEKEEHKVELYELLVAEQTLEITEDEIASFEKDYEETTEIEEAKKLKYEERQKLSDDDFAVVVTVKNKVTGEPRKIRMFPIQDEAHVRNALARLPQAEETLKKLGISKEEVLKKILKRAKELNMDELLKKYEKSSEETKIEAETQPVNTGAETEAKIEETPEVKVEPEVKKEDAQAPEAPVVERKLISITNEETVTTIDTLDGKCERKGLRKTTRKYDNDTEDVFSEEYQVVQTYTEAQLEEEIIAAMPKEVSDRIKELVKEGKSMKEAMKQAWDEYKSKSEKALEEKDTEIKNKTDELGKKDQEIADLKNPIVEEKTEKELTVGTVEIKDRNKEIQKGIDERAFGKR
jgi:hypothetical protein